MTSLQSLEGLPAALYCHKVLDLLRSPSTHQNPILLNQAVHQLRRKALKGDLNAKIKLGTVLDGQLLAEVKAQSQGDTSYWHSLLDKREAELWGQCLFDRWLSSALTPCLGLVESDMQKISTNNDDSVPIFRLIDSILSLTLDDDDNNSIKIKGEMCYLVGLMQLKGVGLEKDLEKAVTYFERASNLEHDGASYQLAMMMEDRHRYPDLYNMEQSVALYEKTVSSKQDKKRGDGLSAKGLTALSGADAWALTKLARAYYEGDHHGQSQNLEKAYHYARKVAECNGEKYCQFMVGDILLKQEKVDIHQALFWLTQSGQQGFSLAIEALARIYFEGYPSLVKPDYSLAYEWCLKGDDIWPSGLGYCQSCLGDMYRQGLGVPKDQMKSFEYYQKAASQQEDPQNYARYMLGEM
ncbi:hypothetical protein BC941DRAFT_435741 [Chlamydoabsidia padenii]|nr:hypothetical protein BC941DRAFT_435741 [Chlamydoabsidia padenii]